MVPTLPDCSLLGPAPQAATDSLSLLLVPARTLREASRSGAVQPLLRGKKLGVLSATADGDDAVRFHDAAAELGAHVAHVRANLTEASSDPEIEHTGRVLGRLYDAIECQGMSAALVAKIGRAAGVPVFHGLACPSHSTAALADLLNGDGPAADNRRFVLQAALLASLASA